MPKFTEPLMPSKFKKPEKETKSEEFKGPTFHDLFEKEDDPVAKTDLYLAYDIARVVDQVGGKAIAIGGFARDYAMNILLGKDLKSKDIDLEIYGMELGDIHKVLGELGELNEVGKSFGVLKLKREGSSPDGVDVSFPREDSAPTTVKEGRKPKVKIDKDLPFAEAAKRRDLTINAIGIDPLTGELLDEHGGIEDIKARKLRFVDAERFKDDPLRVLRVMQFAARFDFEVDDDTRELCRSIDLSSLSKERIGDEWMKLLMKSKRPSVGLEVARDLGIIEQLHPELQKLFDVEQEAEWHPEGDVWEHTKQVVDVMRGVIDKYEIEGDEAKVLMLASVCHDFGKPDTTEFIDGRIRSFKHEAAGEKPTRSFLKTLKIPKKTVDAVVALVVDHIKPLQLTRLNKHGERVRFTDSAVRKLSKRLLDKGINIRMLCRLTEADHKGRVKNGMADEKLQDVIGEAYEPAEMLVKKGEELMVIEAMPKPLITGRDLKVENQKQGMLLGVVKNVFYQDQISEGWTDKTPFVPIAKTILATLVDKYPAPQKKQREEIKEHAMKLFDELTK